MRLVYLKLIILVLFLFSGISSIIYQVIWQRYLSFSLGSDTISSTIVVSVFMMGLGLGSLYGGYLSDKLDTKRRVKYYIIIEIVIALFGIASSNYLYDFIYIYSSSFPFFITVLLSFAYIIIPTFLMGTSLPLLSKIVNSSIEEIKSFTFTLYTLNTFGASVGSFIPIFILVPEYGFTSLLYLAAFLNAICSSVCLLLINSIENKRDSYSIDKKHEEKMSIKWLYIYGLSGYIALSLEIIWFRILSVILKGSAYTFPLLLSFYIGGIALGGAIGYYFRNRIPTNINFFFRLQGLIVLYVLMSIIGLVWIANDLTHFSEFNEHLLGYGRGNFIDVLKYYLVFPLFLFGFPTLLIGISFVALQKSVNNQIGFFGNNLGKLLFANTFCSSIATLITVFIIINFWGTITALIITSMLGCMLVLLQWYSEKKVMKKIPETLLIFSLIITIFFVPSNEYFWKCLHGSVNREIIIKEDMSCVSAIKIGKENQTAVFINGLGQSILPYKYDIDHISLGVLPLLAHPNPTDIAIIGFGSGGTLYGISSRVETLSIDCFEITSNQYSLVNEYGNKKKYEPIKKLFNDSRINYFIKDGRKAILSSNKKYDIIEADALRSNSPGAGNIYSIEYFNLIKSRLNTNGIAVTWAPTDRVFNAFVNVFPYVMRNGSYLLGSNQPISINQNMIDTIVHSNFWVNHFKLAEINPSTFVNIFNNWVAVNRELEGNLEDYNTDLFPKDEYERPLKLFGK